MAGRLGSLGSNQNVISAVTVGLTCAVAAGVVKAIAGGINGQEGEKGSAAFKAGAKGAASGFFYGAIGGAVAPQLQPAIARLF